MHLCINNEQLSTSPAVKCQTCTITNRRPVATSTEYTSKYRIKACVSVNSYHAETSFDFVTLREVRMRTMSCMRRRQLLLLAIGGITCWMICSLYLVVHVGLPRIKDIVQLSKLVLPTHDGTNSTQSRLFKYLRTLRSSPHVKRKFTSKYGNVSEHKTLNSFGRNISSQDIYVILKRHAKFIQPKDEKLDSERNQGNNILSTTLTLSSLVRSWNDNEHDSENPVFNNRSNEEDEGEDNNHGADQLIDLGHENVKVVDNRNLVQMNGVNEDLHKKQHQNEGWQFENDHMADLTKNKLGRLSFNETDIDNLNVDYILSSHIDDVQLVVERRTEDPFNAQPQNVKGRQTPGQLSTQSQESQVKQQLTEDKLVPIKDINMRQLTFELDDPGEDGDPVWTTSDEQQQVEQSWRDYSFNDHASAKISLERSIPDPRNAICHHKKFDYSTLPKTTVIMCFTDESWSVLLRSIHSIINRTPPELLHEILLVDDFSQRSHLQEPLDNYIATNFRSKVSIIRLPHRHGLIRARLVAVNRTTTQVMTFLDSHIECNVGWLEPQLAAIAADRRTVASPVIDTLLSDTFQYVPTADDLRGGFSWNMQFVWHSVPHYEAARRNHHDGLAEPIRTPTIAGGLLSIDRQWFFDIGGYDPGLEIWGTENLELSFKTWMCGGQLLIVPCSRVGHVFRSKSPYTFPGPPGSDVLTAARNNGRVADVWMDEYGQLFLRRFPYIRDLINTGIHPLSIRHQLRSALGCHSFSWYLESVYRELYRPSVSPVGRGELRHISTQLCMDLDRAGRLTAFPCHGQSGSQYFQLTADGRLEHIDFCIGVLNKSLLYAVDCEQQFNNTILIVSHNHSRSKGILKTSDGLCITVGLSTNIRPIVLTQCNSTILDQLLWGFSEYL